jgi:toxin-antitoxin system PIN domain toxin
MLSVDVNVLVYAFDRSARHHASALAVLESQRTSGEALVVLPAVLSGFLRVTTDRRILSRPAEPEAAVAFVDALLASPTVSIAGPGPRHWPLVRDLVATYGPRGPEVSDVVLAATARELGLTWVSFDRGFARFRGLRWVNPAETG